MARMRGIKVSSWMVLIDDRICLLSDYGVYPSLNDRSRVNVYGV